MKKELLISSILTILFLQCYSQSDFKKGYVLLNNNDTIFGSINNRSNKVNGLKCIFIKDGESESTIYYPNDIQAYRFIDGKYYVSMKKTSNDADKIFLEYMFDGIIDLFYYYDNLGDHFFICKEGSELVELKNEKRIQIINGVPHEKESFEYIGVLKNAMKDSQVAEKMSGSTDLSLNPLIKIAEDYHNEVCSDKQCIIYAKTKSKMEISFGPLVGLSSTSIYFTGHTFKNQFDFPAHGTGFELGAFINIKDPSISEKFSMQFEVLFHKSKFLSNISTLKISNIKAPLIIKYTFPFKKIQPSIVFGAIFGNITSFENNSTNSGVFNEISETTQFGWTTGTEINYNYGSIKNVFLQIKYERLDGHRHYSRSDIWRGYFWSHQKTINAVIGFKF